MKPSDRNIREYLLKKDLIKFLNKNLLKYNISLVEEFVTIFNGFKHYSIILIDNSYDEFIYNSKTKSLSISKNKSNLNIEYIQKHLNDLLKLENYLNSFFEEKKLK